MKKEIKIEIEKLFEDMKKEIKKTGLQKTYSHKGKGGIDRFYSKTILDFRGYTILIIRHNPYNWELKDRNEFMRGFGRKTTPYLWFKKELFL